MTYSEDPEDDLDILDKVAETQYFDEQLAEREHMISATVSAVVGEDDPDELFEALVGFLAHFESVLRHDYDLNINVSQEFVEWVCE
jgi:hypothetical protein